MTPPRRGEPVRPGAWSRRRHRLLGGLAAGALVLGGLGLVLPAQYGIGSIMLAALCALLLVAAVVVFTVVPGPGTLGVLLRSLTLAGAFLVVAVLLVLSTAGQQTRWVWLLVAVGAAAWTAFAAWQARGSDPEG